MRKFQLFAIFVILTAPLTSGGRTPEHAAPLPAYKRVILVSIDGLDSRLIEHMPFLRDLRKEGSWTLRAETPLPSITVVSHAAMLTGAGPAKNGVTGFEPSDDEAAAWRPLKVATVLQAVQKKGRLTTAIIQKHKLTGLLPHEATNFYGMTPKLQGAIDAAVVNIEREPSRGFPADTLTFIHLKDIDGDGHRYGWMSAEQKETAARIDGFLSELWSISLYTERDFDLPTLFIVTSDHGGHGKTHGSARKTDMLVPWIAVGPGVRKDHRIRGKVRLIDTAPTVIRALGYDPGELLPDAEGKVISEIFETR